MRHLRAGRSALQAQAKLPNQLITCCHWLPTCTCRSTLPLAGMSHLLCSTYLQGGATAAAAAAASAAAAAAAFGPLAVVGLLPTAVPGLLPTGLPAALLGAGAAPAGAASTTFVSSLNLISPGLAWRLPGRCTTCRVKANLSQGAAGRSMPHSTRYSVPPPLQHCSHSPCLPPAPAPAPPSIPACCRAPGRSPRPPGPQAAAKAHGPGCYSC